ncbi:MAG: DUF5615 family PIN-like protein, partial [Patescibacteria group bacterium]
MRLLADENISVRVVAELRQAGHDVLSIVEIHPNADDAWIIARALKEKRCIITYDKDFGELVFLKSQRHYGVILLRTENELWRAQAGVLLDFFSAHDEREVQKYCWV